MGSWMRLLGLLASVASVANAAPGQAEKYYSGPPVEKDVVIIGGGSSGTHAAIRLHQLGYSVALIEKTGRLGGHVNTYVDPASKKTFDYGVIYFENLTVTNDYFSYLGIETTAADFSKAPPTSYANFHTDGKILKSLPASVPWSNQQAVGAALFKYLGIIAKYPFLSDGYNLPNPVPEDLLLTMGDFLKKYGLEAMAETLFSVNQGLGNVLSALALYNLKYFNAVTAQGFVGGPPLLQTKNMDNQAIYNSAANKLGKGVYLNSLVTHIDRSHGSEVELTVETPKGCKQFKGKKLLIAIEPLLGNLKGLGLDLGSNEEHIFKQLNNSYYWDMIVKDSGIPQSVSLSPIDLKAPLAIPAAPIVEHISGNPIGLPDLSTAYFTSSHYLSDNDVKAQTLETIAKIKKANGYTSTKKPEFVGFNNHSPFQASVSAEAIRKGFYHDMIALQGQKNTFFTGAAWQAHNSAEIWLYNENVLLPQLKKALKK